jgi:hypothetical protein
VGNRQPQDANCQGDSLGQPAAAVGRSARYCQCFPWIVAAPFRVSGAIYVAHRATFTPEVPTNVLLLPEVAVQAGRPYAAIGVQVLSQLPKMRLLEETLHERGDLARPRIGTSRVGRSWSTLELGRTQATRQDPWVERGPPPVNRIANALREAVGVVQSCLVTIPRWAGRSFPTAGTQASR